MIAQVLSTPKPGYQIGAPYRGTCHGMEAARGFVKAWLRSLERNAAGTGGEGRR